MDKMNKVILVIISMTFSSALFSAEGSDIYLGVSYNTFSIGFDSANADVDDTEGYGLVFGVDFGDRWAFETEYLNSGKTHMDYNTGAITSANIKVQSLGVYSVYRTTGKVYFKGRAGFVVNFMGLSDINCTSTFCFYSLYDEGAGLALSAGGGILLSEKMKLEAEYKLIDLDIDTLALGLIYDF